MDQNGELQEPARKSVPEQCSRRQGFLTFDANVHISVLVDSSEGLVLI